MDTDQPGQCRCRDGETDRQVGAWAGVVKRGEALADALGDKRAVTLRGIGRLSNSFGADDKSAADKKAEKMAEKKAELNHITMKDGKMWVMKDGQTTELTETATLMDGTKVMADGSYMEKGEGEKKMLKEGEAINWKGKVMDHEKIMKDIEKHKEKKAEKAAKDAEKK